MKRNDSSDPFEHGLSHRSPSLRITLGAIRRKLWILNTKLQSLSATIELIYRHSGEWVNVDGLGRCLHDGVGLAEERVNGRRVLEGLPARWNRARLRARADRAERRAAVAMNKASVSLSDAFEAVLQAACAVLELTRHAGTSPKLQRHDVPVNATNERTSTRRKHLWSGSPNELGVPCLQRGHRGGDSGPD